MTSAVVAPAQRVADLDARVSGARVLLLESLRRLGGSAGHATPHPLAALLNELDDSLELLRIGSAASSHTAWIEEFVSFLADLATEVSATTLQSPDSTAAHDEQQRTNLTALTQLIRRASSKLDAVLSRSPLLGQLLAPVDRREVEALRGEIERQACTCVQAHAEGRSQAVAIRITSNDGAGVVDPAAASSASSSLPPPPSKLTSFLLLRGGASLPAVPPSLPADLVAPLNQLHAQWVRASNRTEHLAEFFVHLVELEGALLSSAVQQQQQQFIAELCSALHSWSARLDPIASRSTFAGLLRAHEDRRVLQACGDELARLQQQQRRGREGQAAPASSGGATQMSQDPSSQQLEHTWDALEDDTARDIRMRTLQMREADQVDQLRSVLSATVDFEEEEELGEARGKFCVGTRTQAIAAVVAWAHTTPASAAAALANSQAQAALAAADAKAQGRPVPPTSSSEQQHSLSQIYWLWGEAGTGKTTLAATLVEALPLFFAAVHLCGGGRGNVESRRSPANIIKSVACQLALRIPAFRAALLSQGGVQALRARLSQAGSNVLELWDTLLVQPCASLMATAVATTTATNKDSAGTRRASASSATSTTTTSTTTLIDPVALIAGQQRVCVLIDGLDECVGSGGEGGSTSNALLSIFCSAGEVAKLPPWLCFLVTSRPLLGPALSAPSLHLPPTPAPGSQYVLSYADSSNRDDVRLFLRERVGAMKLQLEGGQALPTAMSTMVVVDVLANKSQGMFLCAQLLLDQLAAMRAQRGRESGAASDDAKEEADPSRSSSGVDGVITLRDLEALPDGLDSFYREQFRRVRAALDGADTTSSSSSSAAASSSSSSSSSSAAALAQASAPSPSTPFSSLLTLLELILSSFESLSLESLACVVDNVGLKLDEAGAGGGGGGGDALRTIQRLVEPLCSAGSLFHLQEQQEEDLLARARNELAHAEHVARSPGLAAAQVAAAASSSAAPSSSTSIRYTCVVPCHRSVVDWLTSPARHPVGGGGGGEEDELFVVSILRGHERLRQACWGELVRERSSSKPSTPGSEAPLSADDGVVSKEEEEEDAPPLLRCMDAAADPDVFVPQSSFLSYAVRYGPRHCLAAGGMNNSNVTDPTATAAGSSSSSVVTESFLTRFPFLAAAQFLAHLQYLHLRAALDLATSSAGTLALEYAACEDSIDEWEEEEEGGSTSSRAASSTGASPTTSSPHSWLWLSSPHRAAVSLRHFRLFVQLDQKEWRGSSSGGPHQHAWDVGLQQAKQRLTQAMERNHARLEAGKMSKIDTVKQRHTAATDDDSVMDCYTAQRRALAFLRCPPVSSQLIYAAALAFPASSGPSASGPQGLLLGARKFNQWFLRWNRRAVHRVRWENPPENMPEQRGALVHQVAAAGTPAATSKDGVGASTSSASSLRMHCLSASPNGQFVATLCALDSAVRIFHAVSFQLLRSISPPTKCSVVSWGADNASLALGGYASQLHVFDAHSGERVGDAPLGTLPSRGVEAALFLAGPADRDRDRERGGDGGGGVPRAREQFIVAAGYSNSVDLYDLRASPGAGGGGVAPLRSFGSGGGGHQSRVSILALNSDHSILASAGLDGYVVLWNLGGAQGQGQRRADRAAAAAQGDPDAVRNWARSITPLIILVPPISSMWRRRRATRRGGGSSSSSSGSSTMVEEPPLSMKALAWHPTLPGVLVSASSDPGGNGLCLWKVDANAADAAAAPGDHPTHRSHPINPNPLAQIVQPASQPLDDEDGGIQGPEYTGVLWDPTGQFLVVSSAGATTTLEVFQSRVANMFAEEEEATAAAAADEQQACSDLAAAVASLELEHVGVVDVGNVGQDITCLEFAGRRRSSSSSKAAPHKSLRGLKGVCLLTGDSGGAARVWDADTLLRGKVHQRLEDMTALMRPADDGGQQRGGVADQDAKVESDDVDVDDDDNDNDNPLAPPSSSSSSSLPREQPGLFPRIAHMVSNSRYIVIADPANALHVYSPREPDATFVRSIVDPQAHSLGRVACMCIGEAGGRKGTPRTSSRTLVVSYTLFRGFKQWDVARGVLLRIIGGGLVLPGVPAIKLIPSSSFTTQQQQQQQHQQLLAVDGDLLSIWNLPVGGEGAAAAPLPPRVLFTSDQAAKGRAGATAAAAAQIVAVDVHPSGHCIASVEGRGVKLWMPRAPHTEVEGAAAAGAGAEAASSAAATSVPTAAPTTAATGASPAVWDKHAVVRWSWVAPLPPRQAGRPAPPDPQLCCCAFSPDGRGSVLAVGGLEGHALTLFDTRTPNRAHGPPASPSSSSSSSSAPPAPVLWCQPRGDCVALAWTPCAGFLASVDRAHTVSVWRIPTARFMCSREEQDRREVERARQREVAGGGGRARDVDQLEEHPTLIAQYLNHPLSSSMPLLPLSSHVFVRFVSGGRRLMFHHARENCIVMWRVSFGESESSAPDTRGSTTRPSGAAPVLARSTGPLSTPPLSCRVPVVFHCDRLTSSADLNLIHFMEQQ